MSSTSVTFKLQTQDFFFKPLQIAKKELWMKRSPCEHSLQREMTENAD